MKERGGRKTQASTIERQEKNNLPRVEIRNSMLIRHPPLGKTLLLDQALVGQLFQCSSLVLGAGQLLAAALMAMNSWFSITESDASSSTKAA